MYNVYERNDGVLTIELSVDDKNRAIMASPTAQWVTQAAQNMADEAVLLRNWFGLYRTKSGDFEDKYEFVTSFPKIQWAINYVLAHTEQEELAECWCAATTIQENISIYNINTNPQKNTMANKLDKFEVEQYFTEEALKSASQTRTDVKSKREAIGRVIASLQVVEYKMSIIEDKINSSFNAEDVVGAQKSLSNANRVLEAFNADEALSFNANLGKTKLEEDIKDFDAKAFLED